MTDTTTTEVDQTPESAPTPVPAPEPVPFWQRPHVERYLVPLFLPVVAVLFIAVYVLNISRLFLSGHKHIPVIVGTAITLLILIGGVLLSSNAGRLKKSVLALVGIGYALAILSGGWLVLGHAQEKVEAATTLPATLKTKQTLNVEAAPGGNLVFVPKTLNAKTGLATIAVKVGTGGHTFVMDDPTTLLGTLALDTAGSTVKGTAYFAKAGNYTFYCSIPGHRAAGMEGTIVVTGPPVATVQQAATDAGNPPGTVK